jgi:DNA-binding NtrC family response regulator
MSPPPDDENTATELIHAEVAHFPRARLQVLKGPEKGAEVVLEGQTVTVGSDESCQLRLTDPSVSRRHFELSSGPTGYRLRDLRSTNGTFIDSVQILDVKLTEKARILAGRCEMRFAPEREQVAWPLSHAEHFGDAMGHGPGMRRVFAVLERAAGTDSPLVLEGESGSGKELLARALHARSARREGPFVAVDVGSSAEAVLEVDLFGREQIGGALEEAQGGTLFLDEVSALPAPLQARLERTCAAGELKRASGSLTRLDVRLVASTQRDLDTEVRLRRFREDLFFRLAVFRVRVPALRERPEDIPDLVRLFESRAPADHTPVSGETLEMLVRHDWPGNLRELRNVVERLCAFPDLGAEALSGVAAKGSKDDAGGGRLRQEMMKQLFSLPYHEAKDRVVDSFEKVYLTEHLRAAQGVVTRAAQDIGLPRQSVHRMLRRLGLHSNED